MNKKRLANPWTEREVQIDDGLWHGSNPREDAGTQDEEGMAETSQNGNVEKGSSQ